jgi:hypothetical protein
MQSHDGILTITFNGRLFASAAGLFSTSRPEFLRLAVRSSQVASGRLAFGAHLTF